MRASFDPLPLGELDDQALVERCRAELPYGLEAYSEILRRYETLVFTTALRMIQSRLDAEEITQDAFLTVYHKLHGFEGRSSFKTWLFRIMINLCLRRRSKIVTREKRNLEISQENLANLHHKEHSQGRQEELSAQLNEALDALEPEQREIVILKYISGLSLNEIAELQQAGLSATKMRLYRALEKLKEAYKALQNDA